MPKTRGVNRCLKEGLGGPWSRSESNMHINCLKTLAAFLMIKCFTRDCRSVIILLRMDNMSAITYEQAWGHNFTKFDSHNKKNLALVPAEHLLRVQNVITDKELRVMNDRTDWKLSWLRGCSKKHSINAPPPPTTSI